MQGFILIVLLILPAMVWHFFVLNLGLAALLATVTMGVVIAAMNWSGSWAAVLGDFLGGCLLGLGPALFIGYVYYNVGGPARREFNERLFASGGRRRHVIGGIGGLSIGLALFARFGLEASPRALLGAAAFVALGLGTLAWAFTARK